jgi:hypothetical protein
MGSPSLKFKFLNFLGSIFFIISSKKVFKIIVKKKIKIDIGGDGFLMDETVMSISNSKLHCRVFSLLEMLLTSGYFLCILKILARFKGQVA